MHGIFLASQKGLLTELWEYFVDKYFSPDVPYLENYTFGPNSLVSLRWVILGITFGIILAAIGSVYNKRHIGDFVRKMIYEDCLDADRAQTLYDLGYMKNPGVRSVIKSNGTLSRWVRCVEEDEYMEKMESAKQEFDELHQNDKKPPKFTYPEFKRDCNTMHFYIPEEKKYAAEIKFDDKGANWFAVILIAIVAIVICLFVCYILPDVLKFIDNFITFMKG